MPLPTDVRVTAAALHLLPVTTRVPLKFGHETLSQVTCARVRVRVEDRRGRSAEGWGETPLSVQWGWPSPLPFQPRLDAMVQLARDLTAAWVGWGRQDHPVALGVAFTEEVLPDVVKRLGPAAGEPMPWLAALITSSPFDLALHDAFGQLLGRPAFDNLGPEFLGRDLGSFFGDEAPVASAGRFLPESLRARENQLPAWHLVGGLDPVGPDELTGQEPRDGYPVLLSEWIRRDGLTSLKVKLRGNDAAWDHARMVSVGRLALAEGVSALSADFNCTVRDPAYVVEALDRLALEEPAIFDRLLYVEQPFPYDLEANPLDVHAVSRRKPLFLDESAHDWRLVALGARLGWTGVALKTCKTLSGALLSLAWARARGMSLMVQDLTNPMLAQLPHLLLAAHSGTLRGVETNSMQFYPDASAHEAAVHPDCYRRRSGRVDLSTLQGPGFGYRLGEMRRDLPAPVAAAGN